MTFYFIQMKTFDLNRTIHGVGDLSDGILIGTCLKNMFVEYRLSLIWIWEFVYLVMPIILMKHGYKNFETMLEIITE